MKSDKLFATLVVVCGGAPLVNYLHIYAMGAYLVGIIPGWTACYIWKVIK